MRALALWLLVVMVLSTSRSASAWNVRTPYADPCHERLTLGALGAAPGGWQRVAREPGAALLSTWVTLAEEAGGAPSDRPTQYWLGQFAELHGLSHRTHLEQYVLASFVAGVRAPDFDGLHPSQLGALRGLHVGDHRQPHHALRRSSDAPGETGDRSALEATRRWITERLEAAADLLHRNSSKRIRVSVPHYGEVSVQVFGAAYELGVAAHALQDAYSHTLRDDELHIVAVLNWVNAVERGHNAHQHGSPHSDRLDECNLASSEFDAMRYAAAQSATLKLFEVPTREPSPASDHKLAGVVLDKALSYRSGCDHESNYCDSPWLPVAMEAPTGPLSWAGCAVKSLSRTADVQRRATWAALSLLLPALWLLRRRGRRETSASSLPVTFRRKQMVATSSSI